MLNPVLGTLVIGFGTLNALYPRAVAGFEERIDAVGSKRSEVEPAEWRVSLTRRFGIAVALFGILILFDI